MKEKFKQIPQPLRKQILLRCVGAGLSLAMLLFVLVTVGIGVSLSLVLLLPFFALQVRHSYLTVAREESMW